MTPSIPSVFRTRFSALALLVGAAALSSGCGAAADATSGSVRADLGRAPNAQTLAGIAAEVLRLYGFDLESVEADLVQTDWRYPQNGVRDRATVRIRPRGSDFYVGSIRLAVEAEGEGGGWRPAVPPDEVRGQYADIRSDIRNRLQRHMTQN